MALVIVFTKIFKSFTAPLMIFGFLNMLLSTCERDGQKPGHFCVWFEEVTAASRAETADMAEIQSVFHNKQRSEEINDQDH